MAPELIGSHVLWLVLAVGVHALIGFAFGAALFDRPWVGAIGAVLADLDLFSPYPDGTPLGHRGMTHSALALGVAVAIAYYFGRDVAGAIGVGYASQLAIDVTTPKGIPIAYPLSAENVVVPLNLHGAVQSVVLVVGAAALLGWTYRDAIDRHLHSGRG